MTRPIDAIILDLDGVLVDTEPWWFEARRAVAASLGGVWDAEAERSVKGANSAEWAARLAARLGRSDAPDIERQVIDRMLHRYRDQGPPVIDAGVRAVRRLARDRPLAVGSSSPPAVIEAALHALGLRDRFAVLVSSDEVGVGKPDPAVYIEAARRLGVVAERALVIEDSDAGVASAVAAGMRVVLVPAAGHTPGEGARGRATLTLESLDALDGARLADLEGS